MEQFMNDLVSADAPDATHRRPEVTEGITRGVVRWMAARGVAPMVEFKLANGRRVDVAGLDQQGRLMFVEVKSSLADYRADEKWSDYVGFCDWFYFAVAPGFPDEHLPDNHGLIRADGYDAAVVKPAAETPLHASRRKSLTLRFARQSARRLAWMIT